MKTIKYGEINKKVTNRLRGWALDPGATLNRAFIRISIDDQDFPPIIAKEFRPTMAGRLGSDGYCGYSVVPPLSFFDGQEHRVSVSIAKTGNTIYSGTIKFDDLRVAASEANIYGAVTQISADGVRGWVLDNDNRGKPIVVSVHIDGALRFEIAAADSSKGGPTEAAKHGFGFEFPSDLYDDREHTVAVYASGVNVVPCLVSPVIMLASVDRPRIELEVLGWRDGKLHCIGHDTTRPDGPAPSFMLVVGDKAIGPDVRMKSAVGEPQQFEYYFDPSAIKPSLLISSGANIVKARSREFLKEVSANILSECARLEIERTDSAEAHASIFLAYVPQQQDRFFVFVNGALQCSISTARAHLDGKLSVPLSHIIEDRRRPIELEVRYSDEITQITSSPQRLNLLRGEDLVRNGSLENWTGTVPGDWNVHLGAGAALFKARSPGFDFARVANETAEPASFRFSQEFTVDPDESVLAVVLKGRSSEATGARLRVALVGAEMTLEEAQFTSVPLYRAWSVQTMRIPLPRSSDIHWVKLVIEASSPAAGWIDIAQIAAGEPGFVAGSRHHLEADSSEEGDLNAVTNGDFSNWVGSYRRTASSRASELADGWTFRCKSANPALTVALCQGNLRDVTVPERGPLAYGVAIFGQINEGYARLETKLDKYRLSTSRSLCLAFYAQGASVLGFENTAAEVKYEIDHIGVLERSYENRDGARSHKDRRLVVIKRRVTVTRTGRHVEIILKPDDVAALSQESRLNIDNPDNEYLLYFVWTASVDVALFSVRLGARSSRSDTEYASSRYFALEDPNIAAQLNRTAGLTSWVSQERISAPLPMCFPASDPVKWSWNESHSAETTAIVIPVFNAIDETLDCISSIGHSTDRPVLVTLVDDGSTILNRERLRRFVADVPWIKIVENERNTGYTNAANRGMSDARSKWIVLLNSDTIVTRGWLDGLLEAALARPDAAMIGPLSNAASWQSVPDVKDAKGGWSTNPPPSGISIEDIADNVRRFSEKAFPYVPLLNGFCTLIRRAALDEVGYLDGQSFPMGYGEETDLCIRMAKAGHKLVLADHVYVYHQKSASFGEKRRSVLTKQGNKALAGKHVDINLVALQQSLSELSSLIGIRKALREIYRAANTNI
ncbi:glycosyltransferase family 2 protein [Mesorhizobium sp. LHD-90]|uniref:glycosyltransferase family 2 protein n=1 Tax=Mesorhizobium sp. LHD-90 TaxID=3071414 RepID=UPI0027E1F2A7|nr:glycosyltransferase family 2 protein [Mesorhizobium sp. LHD-90]MDQ6437392.1 glycosyltransferase family 2 protein [Mesorhizobium sp. LHD-90]